MKDLSQAKASLYNRYVSALKRTPQELEAFRQGLDALDTYLGNGQEDSPLRKIVVAFDSFKGSLSAIEANAAATAGIKRIAPCCEVIGLPLCDGGEGLIANRVPEERRIYLRANGPLMETEETCYGIDDDGQTAIIESARICGLPLLTPEQRNPMRTTTYGVGQLIGDALDRGYRNFIIGLGGSATNDAGLGMLQALGYRFYDAQGQEIAQTMCGELLPLVENIDATHRHPALGQASFTAICDVRNPLFGPDGAAFVFAPQKGADAEMVRSLDKGLEHLNGILERITGQHPLNTPGMGAAGGMGAALMVFLHAELKPGIAYMLEKLHFNALLKDADLVLTGEGKSDRQTLMGKVPQGVLHMATRHRVPTILISGSVEDCEMLIQGGFQSVHPTISAPMTLAEAMSPQTAWDNLCRTVEQVCRDMICVY